MKMSVGKNEPTSRPLVMLHTGHVFPTRTYAFPLTSPTIFPVRHRSRETRCCRLTLSDLQSSPIKLLSLHLMYYIRSSLRELFVLSEKKAYHSTPEKAVLGSPPNYLRPPISCPTHGGDGVFQIFAKKDLNVNRVSPKTSPT